MTPVSKMSNKPVMLDDILVRRVAPQCRIILRDIIDMDGQATKDRLIDQLYGHREDGGPLWADLVLANRLHYLRKSLRPEFKIVISAGTYRLVETRTDVKRLAA